MHALLYLRCCTGRYVADLSLDGRRLQRSGEDDDNLRRKGDLDSLKKVFVYKDSGGGGRE